MAPPNSPHQHMGAPGQPPLHHPSHGPGSYGLPPPRAPPVNVGPPSGFTSGRELPALGSLGRAGSIGGSSMSISSMLGGPSAAARESAPPPSHHYSSHSTAPGSGPGFTPPIHAASPRMPSASVDYPPFRRPQTPDHQRPYDPRGSAAPSPHGHYSTPEVPRYGTPQTYHSRHSSVSADPTRDAAARMSAGPPPRPSSQPKAYSGMPPRPMDMGRGPGEDPYGRRDDMSRGPLPPGPDYDRTGLRPSPFDERYRAERERQEMEQREREGRERAYSGSDSGRHVPPHDPRFRETPRNSTPYGRPTPDMRDARDPRDSRDSWGRSGSDPSFRAPMDPRAHPEYPPSTGPYPPHGSPYQTAPPDRYASMPPQPGPQSSASVPPNPYDPRDPARLNQLHPQHQPPPHQGPGPRDAQNPAISYSAGPGPGPSPYDAPRLRPGEEPVHQRNLLAVQDLNRKGRVSPLPQAVQGAQGQQSVPGAEPGIKSEFGRMFSGIGSGVGAIGASSPVTSAPSGPFTGVGMGKREDFENAAGGNDSGPDGPTKPVKGRRRKLKEEDVRDDDSSGRLTPGGKAKRAKGHHHHQYVALGSGKDSLEADLLRSHHHHHHHHTPEATSSPTIGTAAAKGAKGAAAATSPTDRNAPAGHHHHHHHHHHHLPRPPPGQLGQPRPPVPSPPVVIPPKPKITVTSQAVLDAMANRPRHHLGDFIYDPGLKAGRLVPNTPTHRGFSSNPKPLDWKTIEGKENCILTVKVSHVHLTPSAREEITARSFLWGTDIYTDDSDVVAACIHGGWIRGEWSEPIDAAMLDLDPILETTKRKRKTQAADAFKADLDEVFTAPLPTGPMPVPVDRDLHVNIVILPRLLKYGSLTRYGITSREFGGEFGSRHVEHDGLSFMVKSIHWVQNGAQPQARLRGQARRDRMRKAMREIKGSQGNISSIGALELAQEQEEFERRKLKGEIPGNWRRQGGRDMREKKREGSGGDDKENRIGDGQNKEAVKPEVAEQQDKEGDKEKSEAEKENGEGEKDKDVEMEDAAEVEEQAVAQTEAGGETEGKE